MRLKRELFSDDV